VALVKVIKAFTTITKTSARAPAVAVVLRKPRQTESWRSVQVLVLLVERAQEAIHLALAVAAELQLQVLTR
jgi:hypothetical protein